MANTNKEMKEREDFMLSGKLSELDWIPKSEEEIIKNLFKGMADHLISKVLRGAQQRFHLHFLSIQINLSLIRLNIIGRPMKSCINVHISCGILYQRKTNDTL